MSGNWAAEARLCSPPKLECKLPGVGNRDDAIHRDPMPTVPKLRGGREWLQGIGLSMCSQAGEPHSDPDVPGPSRVSWQGHWGSVKPDLDHALWSQAVELAAHCWQGWP